MIDLDRIKADARKATEGPWGFARADRNSGLSPTLTVFDDGAAAGEAILTAIGPPPRGALPYDHQVYTNAHHIANCDPQTVLAMVAAIRAAQELMHVLHTAPDGREAVDFDDLDAALAPFTQTEGSA